MSSSAYTPKRNVGKPTTAKGMQSPR